MHGASSESADFVVAYSAYPLIRIALWRAFSASSLTISDGMAPELNLGTPDNNPYHFVQ